MGQRARSGEQGGMVMEREAGSMEAEARRILAEIWMKVAVVGLAVFMVGIGFGYWWHMAAVGG